MLGVFRDAQLWMCTGLDNRERHERRETVMSLDQERQRDMSHIALNLIAATQIQRLSSTNHAANEPFFLFSVHIKFIIS